MKRILLSLAMIVVVAAAVVGGTGAFFTDEEVSSGNVFAAGEIDLMIDNTSYYNGEFNPETSWSLKNLEDELFFDFIDLKPGDWGEDTISVHVSDNPAWACMDATLTATDENGINEPEETDGDETEEVGELQEQVNFVWWHDDGDNVLEDCPTSGGPDNCVDETNRIIHSNVTLADFGSFGVPLADSTGDGVLSESPLEPGETYYIGKAWCFGEFTFNAVTQDGEGYTGTEENPEGTNGPDVRNSGIICDGSGTDNTAQTDSVEGTLTFRAEQSRGNENFTCANGGIGCVEEADVMLVLDRSGSVSGDIATLQDAAKSFVDALAPSTDGVHMGSVSFADTATLDEGLTDDGTAVKTAIDGITAGGNTNLEDGIETAQSELDSGRAGVPKFMVVITDGEPNRSSGSDAEADAADAADDAEAAGTEIFVVGVGDNVDATYLENDIASSDPPEHYFDAADFEDLEAVLEDLTECEVNGIVLPAIEEV